MTRTAEDYWQSRTRFAEQGRDRCQTALDAERELADDLATALAGLATYGAAVNRGAAQVLARYREARQQ